MVEHVIRRMTASAACLALVALAGGVAEAEEPAQPDIAPNFTLPNAQDGLTRVKWPRDKAVFLTFGEQASQTAIQAWSKRMRKTYGDRMEYYGVAWLDEIPANLLPTAKTVIKTTHPDVLMDTSGSCADRYKCRRGKVNAFVIAPSGEILKRIHEPMNDKLVAQVDGLLEPFTKESNQKTDQSEGDKS